MTKGVSEGKSLPSKPPPLIKERDRCCWGITEGKSLPSTHTPDQSLREGQMLLRYSITLLTGHCGCNYSTVQSMDIRGGIKKFWASGIFPIQIVQCFTPNVQKCVRYWLHLGSYCWLSLFSHNTWSKIHTPIELAKWTKLSTERW